MMIEMNATKFGDSITVDRYGECIGITFGNDLYLTISHKAAENLIASMSRLLPKSVTARQPYDITVIGIGGEKL